MEVIAAVEFEVENVLEEEVCCAHGFSVRFRFCLLFLLFAFEFIEGCETGSLTTSLFCRVG